MRKQDCSVQVCFYLRNRYSAEEDFIQIRYQDNA